MKKTGTLKDREKRRTSDMSFVKCVDLNGNLWVVMSTLQAMLRKVFVLVNL